MLLRLALPAEAWYMPSDTTDDVAQETIDAGNEPAIQTSAAQLPISAKTPSSSPQRQVPSMAKVSLPHAPVSIALDSGSVPQSLSIEPREPILPASPTATPNPTISTATAATSAPSTVRRFLRVNQNKQIMRVYEDGIEIRSIPVSTGKPLPNAFTPAWRGVVGQDWGSGAFRGTNLQADYMWYLFAGAEGSILIHSVPYVLNDDQKIYNQLDAVGVEPVSRGCIRISPEDAAWLKEWNPVSVPIEITPWSGKSSALEN